ncbi:MAG: cutinase family protein [Actinomycetota bacterium]|nr:cutinase family protein [Actinomycetota bacterium]
MILAALLLATWAAAPTAWATDRYPCRPPERVTWATQPVQVCPLSSPLPPRGWVPVYRTPVAHGRGAPLPTPAGWLHGTSNQRFVCDRPFRTAVYYHPAGWRNVWWAFTKSDDGVWGWVPEVFFHGGGDDEPDATLRVCPSGEPTPGQPGGSSRGTTTVTVVQSTFAYSTPYLDARRRAVIVPGTYGAVCEARSVTAGPYSNRWWTRLSSGRWVNNSYLRGGVKMGIGDCAAPRDDNRAVSCSRYAIYGVRGSGEALSGPYRMGETVGATARAAVAELGNGAVQTSSLPYLAAPVSALAVEGGHFFFASMVGGQNMLIDQVRRKIADCPHARIALVGYSQGAAVVSQATRKMTRAQRTHIAAVALYADPYSAGNTEYDLALNYPPNGRPGRRIGAGALGGHRLPFGSSRAIDVCFSADLVCDLSPSSATNLAQALLAPIHSSYKVWDDPIPLTTVIGRFVARRLKS